MRLAAIILVILTTIECVGGCGMWRGIPTHGGGKRFDEEQRVVAGAIRQTLADLDLAELEHKKVAINIECIAQDGGGSVTFPGISNINGSAFSNWGTNNLVQIVPPNAPGQPSLINDNSNEGTGGSVGVTYNPMVSYSAAAMSSMPDLGYFRAALEMKARHAGLSLVQAEPEAVLYVLVDVLGTNRSHTDQVFVSNEKLQASCECTYYAQDAKTGSLIFSARRASSAASYTEIHHFGVTGPAIDRTIARTPPTPLPIDDDRKPATQPSAVTQHKPMLNDLIHRIAGAED
jgi:hypothetical protein